MFAIRWWGWGWGDRRAQFPSSARHFFVCRLVEVWCGRASSLRTMGKCKSMARRKNWRNSRSIPSLKVFTPSLSLSLSFSSYNLLPRAHFLVTDKKYLCTSYFVLAACVRDGQVLLIRVAQWTWPATRPLSFAVFPTFLSSFFSLRRWTVGFDALRRLNTLKVWGKSIEA